ncbi:hypothetical protein GCM10009797_32280 [Nocardioides hwasunensis]
MVEEWHRHKDGTGTAWARRASPTGSRVDIIRLARLRPVELDWSRGRAQACRASQGDG